MSQLFLQSLGFKLMLIVTAGVAIGTLGMTASKISSAMNGSRIPKNGIELVEPTSVQEIAASDIKEIEEEKQTKTSGKCIITLFTQKYDVTEPNSLGKNGDLFECGKDMTATYEAKYGTDVSKMQRYLVASLMVTPGVSPLPTSSNTFNFKDDDDEREDSENEDKYDEDEKEETEEVEPTERPEPTEARQ